MNEIKKLELVIATSDPYPGSCTLQVYVTSDGLFTTTLPEVWVARFKTAGIAMSCNRRGREGFFSACSLAELKKAVNQAFAELCSEELIAEEKVIRYQIAISCSYTTLVEDCEKFHPFVVPGETSEWKTGNIERNANRRGPAGITCYAHPFSKRTFRYKATGRTRVEYKSLRNHGFSLVEDDEQWLANLCGLSPSNELDTSEVSLNADTLSFFRRMFEGVFAMNELLAGKLNPENIAKVAASGKNLLE